MGEQPQDDKTVAKPSRKTQIIVMLIGVAPLFLVPILRHLGPRDDREFWGLLLLATVIAPIFLLYVIAVARGAFKRLRR